LWDVNTGKDTAVLSGHQSYVLSVSFSPVGHTLASGSWNNTIRLWDIDTGKEKAVLRGHQGYILSLSFSPDGHTLASGSGDNTVRLWDVNTGKEMAVLRGHEDEIISLSFSQDGEILASGSGDKTIRLWDLSFLYSHNPTEKDFERAKENYRLRLVDLGLQPIPPERNLHGAQPQPPRWPQTHPFHWLSAAESGDADAMIELGIIYDRDNELDKAWKWYNRALHAGSDRAEERITVFKQWLTLHKEEYPAAYEKYISNPDPPN
jgi:dipeptidyl aminopeptidase/acylaminoacyl peptidase